MFAKNLFKGKKVLVTGGRSGIGYAISKQFLELGASVFICSRKADLLSKAAKELSVFGKCEFHVCDIRLDSAIDTLLDEIEVSFKGLDILVNNAGGQFPMMSKDLSHNGWNAVINNNLNGTFYMCQAIANRFFIPQGAGNIVNIIANVIRGFPGMAHTSAARAGVENLTKTLAQEWALHNIRVNAVAPGTIDSSGFHSYPPPIVELFDKIAEQNLMRRLGRVEEVANAVCFLASSLSSYTSGTTIYVDGMEHLHSNRMGLVELFRSMDV